MDTEATPGVKVDFPNPDNLMNFTVTVKPNDGMYKAAEFQFTVDVPNTYPYDPPKVVCNTLVRGFSCILVYHSFLSVFSRHSNPHWLHFDPRQKKKKKKNPAAVFVVLERCLIALFVCFFLGLPPEY